MCGGWKNYQKLIVGGLEKTESFNSRGSWLLNCFFISVSDHENYSIKNIYAYSKSKIYKKVTSTQNLKHFKMINQRFFIHKFCNNSKMLLSSPLAIFFRALLFLISNNFSIHSYLVHI